MAPGLLDVVPPDPVDPRPGFFIDLANHFGRRSDHERPGGDFHPFEQESARSHHRPGADLDPVEQDRAHADQTLVLDDTAVQDDAVADGDAMADQAGDARVGVNHGEVLKVRPFANADPLGIAPDHRVIPDAGVHSDLDVSQNNGAGRDEGGWIDQRRQGLCSPGVPRARVKSFSVVLYQGPSPSRRRVGPDGGKTSK
jgi:hypothetical protein